MAAKKLDAGKEKNQEPLHNNYTFPFERYEIAKQIFEMQEKGLLDEKFNIKDFTTFKTSKLAKEFPYQGKVYDLADKIKLPHLNNKTLSRTN